MLLTFGITAPTSADEAAERRARIKQLEAAEAQNAKRIAELQERLKSIEHATAANRASTPVAASDEAGMWQLPGSDTSIGFYGFVQLDLYHDAEGRQAGDWAADIGSQPIPGVAVPENDPRTGKTNLTARTSRFGIRTFTPTDTGAVRTVLEADFNKNPSGSDAVLNNTQIASNFTLRLRHAYGELEWDAGRLLAGQTWSTFMNLDAMPETLDFNGHGGAAFVRQAMIRYALKTSAVGDFAIAVENPHGALDGGTAQELPNIDKRPDVTANWTLSRSWGSASVQGLLTEFRYDDGATSAKTQGYGLGAGAMYRLTERDTLLLQYTAGEGLGRYLPHTSWHIASYDAATNRIRLYRSSSYVLGWARAWSDQTRTNLAYGTTRIRDNWDSDFSDGFIDSRRMTEVFANVITYIAKNVEWGLEYSWGTRETYPWTSGGGTGLSYTGERRRYQTSVRFSF